jgi:hypothetical protein
MCWHKTCDACFNGVTGNKSRQSQPFLQRLEYREDVVVGGDFPLLLADRVEADDSCCVDDEQRGTLAEAHHRRRDVVGVEHGVLAVGKERERERVVAAELGDAVGVVGSDGDDRRARIGELRVVLTQLREMFPAKRSRETAQKHKHEWATGHGVGQLPDLTMLIDQFDSWSCCAY